MKNRTQYRPEIDLPPKGQEYHVPRLLCNLLGFSLVANVDDAVEGLLARRQDTEQVALLEGIPGLKDGHSRLLAAHLLLLDVAIAIIDEGQVQHRLGVAGVKDRSQPVGP